MSEDRTLRLGLAMIVILLSVLLATIVIAALFLLALVAMHKVRNKKLHITC